MGTGLRTTLHPNGPDPAGRCGKTEVEEVYSNPAANYNKFFFLVLSSVPSSCSPSFQLVQSVPLGVLLNFHFLFAYGFDMHRSVQSCIVIELHWQLPALFFAIGLCTSIMCAVVCCFFVFSFSDFR